MAGPIAEVKHVDERASYSIKRAASDSSKTEIVFDESQDGALIRNRVIDEIFLCEWRDHQQRQTRSVSAAPLDTSERLGSASACTGVGE